MPKHSSTKNQTIILRVIFFTEQKNKLENIEAFRQELNR